jgi:hypothetical protein
LRGLPTQPERPGARSRQALHEPEVGRDEVDDDVSLAQAHLCGWRCERERGEVVGELQQPRRRLSEVYARHSGFHPRGSTRGELCDRLGLSLRLMMDDLGLMLARL